MQKHSRILWIERYEELKQFKLKKGQYEVPNRYKDNPGLGIWVATIIYQYKFMKEGKKSYLSEDKIEALQAIGFTWQMQRNSHIICIEEN